MANRNTRTARPAPAPTAPAPTAPAVTEPAPYAGPGAAFLAAFKAAAYAPAPAPVAAAPAAPRAKGNSLTALVAAALKATYPAGTAFTVTEAANALSALTGGTVTPANVRGGIDTLRKGNYNAVARVAPNTFSIAG